MIKYLYNLIFGDNDKTEDICDGTFEQRQKSAKNILAKYPDKVPFLISRKRGTKLQQIGKKKFMISKHLCISNVKYVIKNMLQLKNKNNLVIECRQKIISDDDNVEMIYDNNKDSDGFVRLFYYDKND